MKDQADRLREIIENLKSKQDNERNSDLSLNGPARIITVTSGKGGVGKTNITANLAIALSELGKKVAVIDADLGLANIEVLFGISPKYTLLDVVNGSRNIFDVLSIGPGNIRFISGGSGVDELVNLSDEKLNKFISTMTLLDKLFDIVLIDTGAGISNKVLSFIMAVEEVLLIINPEPTSITDAYALVKSISKKNYDKKIKLIINKVENDKEAEDVINKFTLVSNRFLKIILETVGYINFDDKVIKSVKEQVPFISNYSNSIASRQLRQIAYKLIEGSSYYSSERIGIKGFINRFINYINSGNKQHVEKG